MKNNRIRFYLRTIKGRFLVVWALILCLTITQVNAALIAVTDNTSPGGVNNVTHDTVTGLEWLDLTASGGISYDDITLQFAVSGTFEGWRHATRAEVQNLFVNSANLILGSQSVVDPLAVQFMGLLEVTQFSQNDYYATRGLYNDGATGIDFGLSGSAFVFYRLMKTTTNPFGGVIVLQTPLTEVSILDDQPFPKSIVPPSSTGHWLVRAAPIPEPATIVLFVFGSLILQRRKM